MAGAGGVAQGGSTAAEGNASRAIEMSTAKENSAAAARGVERRTTSFHGNGRFAPEPPVMTE